MNVLVCADLRGCLLSLSKCMLSVYYAYDLAAAIASPENYCYAVVQYI